MKTNKIALTVTIIFMAFSSAMAEKPLKGYSFIRGACHGGGQGDGVTIRKELGYAQRLQLTSTRMWLNQRAYQRDAEAYFTGLRNYVRIAHSLSISVMPMCSLSTTTAKPGKEWAWARIGAGQWFKHRLYTDLRAVFGQRAGPEGKITVSSK